MTGPFLWNLGTPKPQNAPTPAATGAHVHEPEKQLNSTQPIPAPAHHAAIVKASAHGLTDDAGEALLRIKPQTYTPRRGELVRLGLVVDSGERRLTSSGRPVAVWIDARLAHSTPKMAPAASRAAARLERGQA